MNRKSLAVLFALAAVVVVSVVWISRPSVPSRARSSGAQPTGSAARGAVKTKARSSKALAALLKPENNVEAPVEDAALAALSKDERARRDQQMLGLLGGIEPKLMALVGDLNVDPAKLTEAQLKEMAASAEKTSAALDQAVEEIMDDAPAAALADKVDAQFAAFESASFAEREAQLPELRMNLEKLVDLIVAKTKAKLGR